MRDSKGKFVKGHKSVCSKWHDKDLLDNAISQCKNYTELVKRFSGAYQYYQKKGDLDYIKSKLEMFDASRSKEECRELALKYRTKKEFKKSHPTVWGYVYHHGWVDYVFAHTEPLGSKMKRANYTYLFPDGAFYAGLTYNLEYRHDQHMGKYKKRTTVTKYMDKTGLKPEYKIINSYVDYKKSQEIEHNLVEEAKKKGYKILNRVRTGGLGKTKKVTIEYIIESASKYSTPSEWRRNEPKIYNISVSRNKEQKGFHNMVCEKAGIKKMDTTKWTFDKIKQFIKDNDCKTRSGKGGLKDLNQSAYNSAWKNGWLNELF